MNTIEILIPARNRSNSNASPSDGTGHLNEKKIQPPKDLNIPSEEEYALSPFITANTKPVNYNCLKNDCIIPVFAKDNEKTIAIRNL